MVSTSTKNEIQIVSESFVHASLPIAKIRVGRGLSGFVVALLVLDSAMKFVKPAPVIEACTHIGLRPELLTPIAAVLLICTALYALPRTAILGAILLTGYLGGAVLCHLRAGDPIATHVLFPVYLGVLIWAGLFLRESRLQTLIPFRNTH